MTAPRLRAPSAMVLAMVGGAAWAYLARASRRFDFAGKTVLVSGGSRGLGLELARRFAAEGARLILLARHAQQLDCAADQLRGAGAQVATWTCDVTDRDQVRRTVAAIDESLGAVDVLVNNAGTIQVGPIETMTLEDYRSAFGVHLWGPLFLMEEVVPSMRRRRSGRIVNIASIGGKVAVPHLSPYAASKFALVGLSEGMRAELAKDGILVTTVCPGLMRTGSHVNALFKGQHEKEYALFALTNSSRLFSISSEAAARKIVEACRYGRAEITLTPQAVALRLANGVFPGLVAEVFGVVNRALPRSGGRAGAVAKTGSESRSPISPSVLTRAADRAAGRNNELLPYDGERKHDGQGKMDQPENPLPAAAKGAEPSADVPTCSCTHPTHFTGRCRTEISPPEQMCADCMENHFHRADDPAI